MLDAIWIISTGALIALSCSLVGNYLILRKQAMLGDALSHAILPGIVIAYMLGGMQNSLAYLVACSAVGVVSIALIDLFKRNKLLNNDIAIGLSFTGLFALGIVLISFYAGKAHLDFDHVLYGEIAYVPLEVIQLGTFLQGPKAFWISLLIFSITLGFIILFYRALNITSFNEEFSNLVGIKSKTWHYSFLSLVSLIVVASFESVGAILVVSFLVIPSATAYILTNRIRMMFLLSSVFSISSAAIGYGIAYSLNSSIAASMAVASGILFSLSFALKLLLSRS